MLTGINCRLICAVALLVVIDVSAAWSSIAPATCSDVVGQGIKASYLPSVSMADSFNGDLYARYEITGSPISGNGQISETQGILFVDSGDAPDYTEAALIENRVIWPSESFVINVKIAIDPNSTGNFLGGIGIFDNATNQNILVGIGQEVDWENIPKRNLIAQGTSGQYVAQPIVLADMQFVSLRVEYLADLGALNITQQDFGYSALFNISNFSSGFSIGFFSNAWPTPNGSSARLSLAVSDLQSDLTTDAFAVGYYPFTLASTGEIYDQSLDSYFPWGTGWQDYNFKKPYFASTANTTLSLTGANDLNLFLVSIFERKVAMFSAFTDSFLEPYITQAGGVIDAYIPGVLLARGAADYEWACAPASITVRINASSLQTATGGDTVVLSGTGFGSSQGSSAVNIGGNFVTATSWSDTSISLTVPVDLTAGLVSAFVTIVTPEGLVTVSNSIVVTIVPHLLSVSPVESYGATSLSFSGSNFGPNQADSHVMLDSYPVAVSSWSQTSISGLPSAQSPAGAWKAFVHVNGLTSNELPIYVRPHIDLIYPIVGSASDVLRIYGSRFGDAGTNGLPDAGSWVSIGGVQATVISWGPSEIRVFIPQFNRAGNVEVSVTVNSLQSNVESFQIESSRNPNLTCYQQYGAMLSSLQAVFEEMDQIIPIGCGSFSRHESDLISAT